MFQKKNFLAALAVFAIVSPAAASLITNGDFETGDLSGWTVTPTDNGSTSGGETEIMSVETFSTVAGAPSNAGIFNIGQAGSALDFDPGIFEGIVLSQTFTVTTAGMFDVGVDVAVSNIGNTFNGTAGEFTLSLDGFIVDDSPFAVIAADGILRDSLVGVLNLAVGIHIFSIAIERDFLATLGVTPLQYVDNAFVVASAPSEVPLPAAFPLFLAGFLGIRFVMRRRSV